MQVTAKQKIYTKVKVGKLL